MFANRIRVQTSDLKSSHQKNLIKVNTTVHKPSQILHYFLARPAVFCFDMEVDLENYTDLATIKGKKLWNYQYYYGNSITSIHAQSYKTLHATVLVQSTVKINQFLSCAQSHGSFKINDNNINGLRKKETN